VWLNHPNSLWGWFGHPPFFIFWGWPCGSGSSHPIFLFFYFGGWPKGWLGYPLVFIFYFIVDLFIYFSFNGF
jgi:hypothetical protein